MNPYTENLNFDWLTSHTLYFGGLLMKDSKGNMLEFILNDFLEEYNGKIIKPEVEDFECALIKSRSLPEDRHMD
jgi:hypothetical protein